MIYFRLQLALVLLFILSLDAHAQSTADSLWLDEVQVSASRIDILDTYQSVSSFRIDSAMLVSLKATSVSDVLQYYSPLLFEIMVLEGFQRLIHVGFHPLKLNLFGMDFH